MLAESIPQFGWGEEEGQGKEGIFCLRTAKVLVSIR
jgi:hypothetical protein